MGQNSRKLDEHRLGLLSGLAGECRHVLGERAERSSAVERSPKHGGHRVKRQGMGSSPMTEYELIADVRCGHTVDWLRAVLRTDRIIVCRPPRRWIGKASRHVVDLVKVVVVADERMPAQLKPYTPAR